VSLVDVRVAITQAHHEAWARVVATLTRRFGDLDIAEEAAAEAFATAVHRWPADGVPPSPGGLTDHRGLSLRPSFECQAASTCFAKSSAQTMPRQWQSDSASYPHEVVSF
jgi:hypothetical protein